MAAGSLQERVPVYEMFSKNALGRVRSSATQAHSLSTWKAEAGRSLSLRPAQSTEGVTGQPGMHGETPSQEDKMNCLGLGM